jgi:predicted restriction endonuclease
MPEFIDDLKKEHAEIKDSLQEISEMDLHSKEARSKLMEMKEIFINHIQKEDDEMYPRLKEASSDDEHLMNVLKYFEDEIKLISQFVSIFFNKFSNKTASEGFEREFRLISSTLIKRIDQEEEVFFPEYENMSNDNSSEKLNSD